MFLTLLQKIPHESCDAFTRGTKKLTNVNLNENNICLDTLPSEPFEAPPNLGIFCELEPTLENRTSPCPPAALQTAGDLGTGGITRPQKLKPPWPAHDNHFLTSPFLILLLLNDRGFLQYDPCYSPSLTPHFKSSLIGSGSFP